MSIVQGFDLDHNLDKKVNKAIAFYLNETMALTKSLIIVICSFMVYEQPKVTGSCVANIRIAEHSIDKANRIDDVPTMDAGGNETVPKTTEVRFDNVDKGTVSIGSANVKNNMLNSLMKNVSEEWLVYLEPMQNL